MAEPLLSLSLSSSGTMKHIVPWKTRSDFLEVYKDLYSDELTCQESAVGRISAWKSRAGNKLSVAIESSGSLMSARVQHLKAELNQTVKILDNQLRYGYSLALIRFVNQVTEKAQTKAVAQPVHLIAREFGIPEWIVRQRHDATHSALPSLDTLATGAKWALDYLKQNFWEHQKNDAQAISQYEEGNTGGEVKGETSEKSPCSADVRTALQEYIQIRLKKIKASKNEETASSGLESILAKLNSCLVNNRMRLVKCMLEDEALVASELQLIGDYCVDSSALLSELPPSIPKQMALVWRPLLKRFCNVPGALPFLLHNAIFSVTSEYSLRNYLLVAWIRFILTNTSTSKSRSKKKRKEVFMRTPHRIPTRVLLSACIQNMNKMTVHLLRHLVDVESLGEESHAKLTQLLQLADQNTSSGAENILVWSDTQDDDDNDDINFENSGSESDTIFRLQDIKGANGGVVEGQISSSTVEDIESNIVCSSIQWNVCTDLVDWSTIPLGMLPESALRQETLSEESNQNSVDDMDTMLNSSSDKLERSSAKERRGYKHNNDDDEEEEDSDDQELSPKRSKLIVTDDVLL